MFPVYLSPIYPARTSEIALDAFDAQ